MKEAWGGKWRRYIGAVRQGATVLIADLYYRVKAVAGAYGCIQSGMSEFGMSKVFARQIILVNLDAPLKFMENFFEAALETIRMRTARG